MTCDDFQALQLARWQGHESEGTSPEAAAHADKCPSCREDASAIPSVLSLLHQADDAYVPSSNTWNRIEREIGAPTRTSPSPVWGALKLAAAVLAAASLLMVLKNSTVNDHPAAQTAATVRDLLASPAPGRPAVGKAIAVGEAIDLAEGEDALLDLPGAGRVELRGPATCSFTSRLSWKLDRGELTADITPGGSGFQVTTPCAEVTVKGTLFRVTAAPRGTALTVARGVVRIANAQGAKDVPASMRSMARRDAAPSGPEPVKDMPPDAMAVGEKLARDPSLCIDASQDGTLRFHLASPHAKLLLQPPAASPKPYYLLNCLDSTGNVVTIPMNDLGGNGSSPVAVEGAREMTQEFKLKAVSLHPGVWLVTGAYVGTRGAQGEEWQGIVESAPVLYEVK